MIDKFNPEVGDIWWFETNKKHCLILTKDKPDTRYNSYSYIYHYLQLENGLVGSIFHGTMQAHGEGWFRKIV